MAGKLLRNLKQIGTICFAIFCLVFPNFSWANCTDDTYRMKFEDGNWLYQKCTGGNWVSDQSPGHYSCGAGTNIPDSTNDAKIWSGKIWDDDQNLYAYWRGPGKKLDSEGFALTEDVCIGCTRNEYYDTEEAKCKKSIYAPPCDTTQSAGQSCTFNDGAASAICKDIGFKSYDESVLTCVAQTCKEGYLLKLSTKRNGKSDGRCYTKDKAEKTCPAKPNDCNGEWGLKLYLNPNTQEADKAYIPGDCECKTQSGAVVVNTTEVTDFTQACKNISEYLSGAKYSMQFGDLSMVDDDISEGAFSTTMIEYNTAIIRWKPADETGYKMTDFFTSGKDNSSDLASGEWAVSFLYGIVKGKSKCVSLNNAGQHEQDIKEGKPFVAKFDEDSSGDHCVCKANKGKNWVNVPVSDFPKGDNDMDRCRLGCAFLCANSVGTEENSRNLIYGCNEVDEPAKQEEKPTTKPEEKTVNPEVENAKQVLSGFFASASANRNVWKNEEGKFNTARLASDLGAAVVLGTVGGVVSGTVIKKKQIKKGFESLQCYIGGKLMAGWGDTFNVDLAR